jgi:FKBP-type peptidyl-prolyl cis-trans isomerase 2
MAAGAVNKDTFRKSEKQKNHKSSRRKEPVMDIVKQGDTVRVDYTGKLDEETIFITTLMDEPMMMTVGEGRLLPGFENAIIGMEVGEWKSVKIPPQEGYGHYIENHTMVEERSRLPEEFAPKLGERYQFRENNGGVRHAKVLDITDTHVTFDLNHPLAGQEIIFDINLIEIVKKA